MKRLSRVAEATKIVTFCFAVAILYGVLHDIVTANLCVEYFTIAHPPVFPTENPFLLALGWGILATWWVGLPLGILLAASALVGPRPVPLRHLRRRIVLLMVVSGAAALISGLTGLLLGAFGSYPLTEGWNQLIPAAKHSRFAFDAWAHLASYAVGMVGGATLMITTALSRRRGSSTNPV